MVIPFETLDDDLLDVHPVYVRARGVLPTVRFATRCTAADEYDRSLMSRGIVSSLIVYTMFDSAGNATDKRASSQIYRVLAE